MIRGREPARAGRTIDSGRPAIEDRRVLGPLDVHLFHEGTHRAAWRVMGAHPATREGVEGTWFACWAPRAERVAVVGDFDRWRGDQAVMERVGEGGLHQVFVPGVGHGARYKYRIWPAGGGAPFDKADPFAFACERPPRTASLVWQHRHAWGDGEWLANRAARHRPEAPMSIYEVHLGSFVRSPDHPHEPLGYRIVAERLVEHVLRTGFTHVELMPVMEHPFYGSWGYHVTGYFAPSARQGTPEDLMYLVDRLHQAGIGVLFDWVPAHFPDDPHGLIAWDGAPLYEHADPLRARHPEWGSLLFDHGRPEVRSFLLSSAAFWIEVFHADGLRVDGVASMLYRDYARGPGQWTPNAHGGREDWDAVAWLRQLNEAIHEAYPGVVTVAEESTDWPGVTAPTDRHERALGFDFKWDMGWMHDTLRHLARDPVHRRYHHDEITFRSLYAFDERWVMPLSHDEVVHLKRPLALKAPGDRWQQLATLRLLLAYQTALPGKKLLFMGGEIAALEEWDHDRSLPWHLLEHAEHRGVLALVTDLNALLRAEPALHELDCDPAGFAWICGSDADHGVLLFERRARSARPVVVVCHFTPTVREGYRVGLPRPGPWSPRLCTDAPRYGGSGAATTTPIEAEPVPCHDRPWSAAIVLPPLSVRFLVPEGATDPGDPSG
ncbi:MAG: 1,4-alpha-glucan branching protein GlgB [Myxococcota bacterium]|nr:1,4-alpha-glucan branching protein GlgB [Myxococcota bacterium]